MSQNKENKKDLKYLIDIMETLRGPNGCPWDKEQTLKTLKPHTLEEVHEVLHAIDTDDRQDLKEELGDLLFQIVFACQLTKEEGSFDMGDVIETIAEKMVRRHPHVFGDGKLETAKEVLSQWADIKEEEKSLKEASKKGKQGYLSEIPKTFPSLIMANKVSEKAAKTGYDWQKVDEIFDKVEEEIEEFKEALQTKDRDHMEEEMGDILFALVNLARFTDLDAEEALRRTTNKFITRFHYIEEKLTDKGSSLTEATLDEMEELWNESKQV